MKKLVSILVAMFLFSAATAQVEHSIIIDSNSFRAVQTDALAGVNIDPISVDSSRNPCARIKVKINRMTKEEINKLDVKIATNNQLTKCKTADYDNGLILEMTAKSESRFYLYHPEFGESNEVTLNLEPNKEYYMEAHLNQTYSIVVNSNVIDADVYLDGEFKGRTDANFGCTIKKVLIGSHNLKLVYGGISNEQKIEVNGGSIFFRQNVNTDASKPQFVVFSVEPKSAIVTIDNRHYSLQDGTMHVVLENGTYNYTVSATGYHQQSGTFIVSGAKVEKVINLKADFATVTLVAPENSEIWVNGEKKGRSKWTGALASGAYIFEARKDGHRSATISKTIKSDNDQQSIILPAPTPIVGSLVVTSTPLMADITLDGKDVGRTPIDLSNVLVGTHTVKLSKSGYSDYTQKVEVSEGKTATISATLTAGNHKAKNSSYEGSNAKTNNSVRGFESHVTVNTDLMFNDFGLIVGGTYTAGRRFNDYIFLGGGIGLSWYGCWHTRNVSGGYQYEEFRGLTIPLYAKFRGYLTKTRVKPFFDVSLGMDICIEKYYYYPNDSFGSAGYPGLHINPAFGISWQCGKKLDMYLSTGFRYFAWKFCGMSINLGFAF